MARVKGVKVIPCPQDGCAGRVVALPGETGKCKECGKKVLFSKTLLEKLEKARAAAKAPAEAAPAKKAPAKKKKKAPATTEE
jgi:hypothetical protein